MLKKILNTVAARFISALASFATIVFVAKFLRTSGLGTISLLANTIFIMNLINGILGGASLVYLIPLNKNKAFIHKTLFISYGWILGVTFCVLFVSFRIGLVDNISFVHTFCLTVLASFSTSNALVLLAFEKVNRYNETLLIQIILSPVVFLAIHFIKTSVAVEDFIFGLYVSYTGSLIFSCIHLRRVTRPLDAKNGETAIYSIFKKLMVFGFLSQVSTIVQYLNYRISIFLLNKFSSIENVGIYSVALRITEAIWMISSSIALVQYARVSNQKNDFESIHLTIKLSKVSLAVTLLATGMFVCLPSDIFIFLFGREFTNIPKIGLALSVGIVSIGYSTIFAHFFSGKGKYSYNVYVCIIGFLINLLGNLLFLKSYGMMAAAFTSTVSYAVMSGILFLLFVKKTDTPMNALWLKMQDFQDIVLKIKNASRKIHEG